MCDCEGEHIFVVAPSSGKSWYDSSGSPPGQQAMLVQLSVRPAGWAGFIARLIL